MSNGFLGYQASFMLDVVVLALVVVVPVLLFSVYQVKFRQNYGLHKFLQLALAIALLFTVAAFEVDLQLVYLGWENVVNKDPLNPRRSAEELESIRSVLHVHLCFAVTTPLLWATTIVLALKRFPDPATPSTHSRPHKCLGWLSTVDLTLTSITGLWFYYRAFMVE